MKKQILSILLTLCMILCFAPTGVFAEGETTQKVETEQELVDALADSTVDIITLKNDIAVSSTLIVERAVTLDIYGYMLEISGSGSVIKVADGGHLTLEDSDPQALYMFTPDANGLWKWVSSGGTKAVRGGIIYGGTGLTDRNNNGYGGGVYVDGGGRFTMNGGSIVGCKAEGYIAFGGGVFVAKGGQFTMTGGRIVGCTAVADEYGHAYGGGVRNDGEWQGDIGRTTLSGTAEIRDCHAKGAFQLYGGGVSDAGTLTISGDVKIIGCTAGGMGSDAMYVNANNDSSVTGGTFYGSIEDLGNKINGLTVTYHLNNDKNYATQVLQSGDQIILPNPAKPGYAFDGWYKDGAKWEKTTLVTENLTLTGWLYAPVTGESELTTALADSSIDVIRLTSDIKLSNELQITNNRKVTLDLNGYVLDLGGKHISVLDLGNTWYHSNELTIMDSRPNEPHKFTDNDGLWKPDENGDKTVSGGIITGGSDGSSAITVGLQGTVTMNGGSIVGCSGYNCGGAVSARSGTFIINGGSIIDCKTDFAGGAVYVLNGKFEMNGGSITDCVVTSPAGDGGAVYVSTDSTFTMTGGSIADCTAVNGSALYLKKGTMNAGGGTVGGTVVLESNSTIQGSGSNATQFNGAVTNYGKIGHGTFSGTVTLGDSNQVGTITGGTFNGPVTTDSEGEAEIGGGVFNKTVTINRGRITNGTFNKDVVVYNAQVSFSCTTLTGGTYNGLILNKSAYAAFAGAHSPLGIVEIKPSSQYSNDRYRTVTFDPAGGNMDYPVRYFLDDGNISNQIVPASRAGYFFAGWYKADGTAWNHSDTVGEDDLTLTAHWTACDHSDHTGAQPDCTTSVTCTACGGTIAALGHNFSVELHNENEHWKKCSRCDAIDGKEPHDWDTGTVTKPVSCVVSGEKTYTCTDCGFEKIEPIDAKGHNYGEEWQHDATHHWHSCRDCDAKDSYVAHSGGTATCTEKAKCEACGESYGDLDPMKHSDGTEQWTTKTATAHEKKWSCCGAVIVASEAHKWADGVCSECGYVCLHDDTDKNHICDLCGKVISNHEDTDRNHICDYCDKTISNHEDTDKNHVCDYCGKTISNHEDTDNNHVCDYCGKTITNHEDTDKNHVCDYCGKVISNHEDTDKNHICDYCGKVITNHVDADKNHVCDYCDKTISNHEDTDKNHICDYCEKTISNHEDADKNHVCDYCGKTITNHTGGKATCKDKAICDICGKSYGELGTNNHSDLTHIDAKTATKDAEGNIEYWYCDGCGKYYGNAAATKEITKADTVIKKLSETSKSPKTGDNNKFTLWIVLLFISGGAFTGVAVLGKKKKFFVK